MFIANGPGNVLTRDDLLPEQNSPDNGLPKSSLRESTVRIFGNTAVLMGRVITDNPQHPMTFLVTTVFQNRSDAWRVIAAQMTKAPVNAE